MDSSNSSVQDRDESLILISDPLALLVPDRFDLTAKLSYIRWYCSGKKSSWPKDLYLDHIMKWNNFCEPGSQTKTSERAFLSEFDQIIESISTRGFDPSISSVSLGSDLKTRNGSHRTAACIYFKRPMACRLTNNKPLENPQTFRYFEKLGMERQYLDAMALEYTRYKPNTFLALIWPAGQDHVEAITSFMLQHTRLVYQKDFVVTLKGHINIVKECYFQSTKGTRDKGDDTWTSSREGQIRALLLEADSLATITEAKKQARLIANIEHHSIHTTDTTVQLRQLASIVFNENCLRVFNQLPLIKPPKFAKCFENYRKALGERSDCDSYCLAGKATLAAFGLRDCDELEYFSSDSSEEAILPPEFSVHRPKDSLYPCSLEEVVDNPNLHFHYFGLKFISIEAVLHMLQKRNEKGDAASVAMIRQFCVRQQFAIKTKALYQSVPVYRFFRYLRRRTWRRMKMAVKQVLRALGIKKFSEGNSVK